MMGKIKLSTLLESVEFDYVINDDNTLSLVDLLGANLGNIEGDIFEIDKNLASDLIERLERYIHDYFVEGYVNTLQEECNEIADRYNYSDVYDKMKKYPDKFEGCIELMEAIINPDLVDISEILEEKEITEKCPRCGSRLYKSLHSEKHLYCRKCKEDFYSFECMGEVICTNELISKIKQTNIEKKDKDFILPDEITQQHDQ
jgi:hypothetical protein|nr:MAG TPA: TFIIB Transcription factor zinc-finger [Caudoviricetes sp.]